MISLGNKSLKAMHIGGINISVVYKGAVKVWEAIRSCFGSGFWVNTKGWINKEGWK